MPELLIQSCCLLHAPAVHLDPHNGLLQCVTVVSNFPRRDSKRCLICLFFRSCFGLGRVSVTVWYLGSNSRKRKFWPKDRGEYCRFVLYKENRDTPEAVSIVALKPANISVAGNKDRRAVTSQLATVYRTDASDLAALNRRNIMVDDAHVSKCIEAWKENGFINYYGCQRFGTGDVRTFEIGKYRILLQHKINSRNLYLHSYQSYLWNIAVSRRLQKYGKSVMIGDLVMKNDSKYIIDFFVDPRLSETTEL
ncbi:unnamed protein product [Soboliphyme baturini]|uniref:TRUD domain-containing protein n=1 Tax=Soboliphyme baturini TaxID=241478 RepID=A0A183ID82_9BILA|nr:unnamed protein product [Soboliphyme baturini]